MKHIFQERALAITAQTLAITSSLLAIGIEAGIIAGGYYIFKKMTETLDTTQKEAAVVVQEPYPKKKTLRDKLGKIKNIVGAVIG